MDAIGQMWTMVLPAPCSAKVLEKREERVEGGKIAPHVQKGWTALLAQCWLDPIGSTLRQERGMYWVIAEISMRRMAMSGHEHALPSPNVSSEVKTASHSAIQASVGKKLNSD